MSARGGMLAAALAVAATLSLPAQAIIDDTFVFTLADGDPVFYDIDLAPPGFVLPPVGMIGEIGGYNIIGATVTLSEAEIISDDSAAQGKPWATFADNYLSVKTTMTVTGTGIFKSGLGFFPLSGPVLVAEVAGTFQCYQKDPRPGETNVVFHAIQYLDVVGGEFWSGNASQVNPEGVVVPDTIRAKYVFDNVWGDVVPITDFSTTIMGWSTPDTEIHFTPEPAAMAVLAFGALGLLRRKKSL